MKRSRRRLVLAVLVLCALCLSGCGFRNKTLDAQLPLVVAALNEQDQEALRSLLHPSLAEQTGFEAGFQELLTLWTPVDAADARLIQFHSVTGNGMKQVEGLYAFPGTELTSSLYLAYQVDGAGGGLISVRLVPPEANQVEEQPIWLTIYLIVCAGFIIFTIVDIVRQKPLKYGWYIVLAVFTFRFFVNGTTILYLPLGSLIYWAIRKKLLWNSRRERAKQEKADSGPEE